MGIASKNCVNSEKPQTETWATLSQDYQVSNFGNVRSLKSGTPRILKVAKCGWDRGYCFVGLRVNGKTVAQYVHRLVAQAFIPNPEDKPQVNHKDGDRENNAAWNLEWVTAKENMRHANDNDLLPKGERSSSAIYSEAVIRRVCEMLQDGLSLKGIREETGLTPSQLHKIKARQRWKHVSKDYLW